MLANELLTSLFRHIPLLICLAPNLLVDANAFLQWHETEYPII